MIKIKNERELELMRYAGMVVSKTHEYLIPFIKEGITTKKLDNLATKFIESHNCIASCIGYEGYPAALCTSVNDTVVHGIPDDYSLKNGDIITIDIVVSYKGYHGDSAWTYAVGDISDDKKYLMEHTYKALLEGISKVKPGNRIGDISNAIECYANKHSLGIVRELCGHGIGMDMHEDPDVPNYGKANVGPRLKEGMVICIEPMLTFKERYVYVLDDGWTVKTQDGSDAAHYEHTILVTKDGYEILTPRLEERK